MKRSDRQTVIGLLVPRLPDGWTVTESGQAIRIYPGDFVTHDPLDAWWIDCPTGAGSGYRRAVGRFKATPCGRGMMWTQASPRFLGLGWEQRLVDWLVAGMADGVTRG